MNDLRISLTGTFAASYGTSQNKVPAGSEILRAEFVHTISERDGNIRIAIGVRVRLENPTIISWKRCHVRRGAWVT
jgi:hypothetical protein